MGWKYVQTGLGPEVRGDDTTLPLRPDILLLQNKRSRWRKCGVFGKDGHRCRRVVVVYVMENESGSEVSDLAFR